MTVPTKEPCRTLEEVAKEGGFESLYEFYNLCSSADMSTPAKIAAFKHWQFQDGTKTGLLELQPKTCTDSNCISNTHLGGNGERFKCDPNSHGTIQGDIAALIGKAPVSDMYDEVRQALQALMSASGNIQSVMKVLDSSTFGKTMAHTALTESAAVVERQSVRLNKLLGRWEAQLKAAEKSAT